MESKRRSLAKAICWRIIASTTTLGAGYVMTGSATVAMSIVGIDAIIKSVLYYMHERAWAHTSIGVDDE